MKIKRFLLPSLIGIISTIATLLSLLVRFGFNIEEITSTKYIWFKVVLNIAIVLVAVYLSDLYKWTVIRNKKEYLFKLFQSFVISIIIYALIYAMFPELTTGRGIFAITISILFLLLLFLPNFYRFLMRVGAFTEKIIILGTGKIAETIAKEILNKEELGYKLIGMVSPVEEEKMILHGNIKIKSSDPKSNQLFEVPLLGGYKDIQEGVKRLGVEQIVIALEERRVPSERRKGERRKGERRRVNIPLSYLNLPEDRRRRCDLAPFDRRGKDRRIGERRSEKGMMDRGSYMMELLKLKVSGVRVIEGARFFENLSGKVFIDFLTPSWFLFNEGFEINKISLFIKDIFEKVFSIAVLVLLSPIFVLTAIAILIESGPPLFYVQVRCGKNGIPFRLIKFRSMSSDVHDGAGDEEGRVTLVGRVIRRYRIDEIPQLLNIIKGDMSLVGPRPEQPHFIEKFRRDIPFYDLRFMVKPGMTGWAQVMYPSAKAEDAKEKLQYDLFYIKNFNIFNDFIIIVETLKVLFLGRR